MGRFGLVALVALASGTAACAQPSAQPACNQQWVKLTGRVVDEAQLLSADTELKLTADLASLEARNGRQLVVATVATLQGKPIEAYSLCLANHWGVGRKGVDDGVVLLVAPNERRVRIEVGSGLESVVTDKEAQTIINEAIVPAFKTSDFERGITSGSTALLRELQ